MAKMTQLALVQNIMSAMNSDSVTSITDTPESVRVADILESTFWEMIDRRNWPHLQTVFNLGSATNKIQMAIPVETKEILRLQYNKRRVSDPKDKYTDVDYLTPDEFLDLTNGRDSSATDIDQETITTGLGGSVELNIRNDIPPEKWTSFDDESIVFDSYDKAVSAALEATKTQVLAYHNPTYTQADANVPELPAEAFSSFLAEAKSTCFAHIKQAPDAKAEQQARRSSTWLSRKAWTARGGVKYPDFGRRNGLSPVRRSTLLDRDAT